MQPSLEARTIRRMLRSLMPFGLLASDIAHDARVLLREGAHE